VYHWMVMVVAVVMMMMMMMMILSKQNIAHLLIINLGSCVCKYLIA